MSLGRVYRRRDSRFYWIEIWKDGKAHRESSKSTRKKDAERLLAKRITELRVVPGHEVRVSLGEALDSYLEDAERRSVVMDSLKRNARIVLSELGDIRIHEIDALCLYELQRRLAERYAAGTTNRIVSSLMAALRFCARIGRLAQVPIRPHALPNAEPRQGFLEFHEYNAIRRELPEWARDVFSFCFYSGWRKMEVIELEWSEVHGDVVRLRPRREKTRRGRVLPLTDELANIINRQRGLRRFDTPLVFHRDGGRIVPQTLGVHFRRACRRAGVSPKLIHDCRRTAVRDLVRAGVPDKVAMQITGHQSRAVFDRYNIVDENDLREAQLARSRYLEAQREKVVGFGEKKA